MPHMHGTVNEVTRGSKAHQRRLMMTLTLTGTVFVAEIVGAIITGSLALLVDAGHMLTDMSVLIASTVTAVLMRRKPNSSRTWGWARLEVLTAEAGAMILLFVGLYALIEAGMDPPNMWRTVGCCCSSAFWVWLPMSARSSSLPGSITTT